LRGASARGARDRRRGRALRRGARRMSELQSPAKQLIDGKWVDALDGGRWDLIDPGTEDVVTSVPFGGAADVNKAIDAAQRELPKWKARSAYDRGAILYKAAALMRDRAPELGKVT